VPLEKFSHPGDDPVVTGATGFHPAGSGDSFAFGLPMKNAAHH
jgi:hypothetical protein